MGHPVQITGMNIKNVKALFWILNHCNCINSNGYQTTIAVLSENFEETCMAHYMIIWCHELVSWFSVHTAHSREFVYDFRFVSCKRSQKVAFRIYLHEVNSNFHLNRHFRREALCSIHPDISLDENLHSCKNQWSCWKKSLKGLKDKVCDSQRITSIRIPSSEPFLMFVNIRFWDCAILMCIIYWKLKRCKEHQLKANNHLSGENILQKCTCTDYLQW